MDLKSRLLLFIEYKGITVQEFEKQAGLSNASVSKMGDNTRMSTLDKISNSFPELNINWLRMGVGDMLVSSDNAMSMPSTSSLHIIKYYPNVDGTMGGLQFLENPNETSFDITIPGYSDCKYAINAYGDSMYPLIQSGQIILLVPWMENFIEWGRIYLIVTKSGYRSIKRIFPASDNEHILCKSENEDKFPPFEIEKNAISNVYLVKGWICRNEI